MEINTTIIQNALFGFKKDAAHNTIPEKNHINPAMRCVFRHMISSFDVHGVRNPIHLFR